MRIKLSLFAGAYIYVEVCERFACLRKVPFVVVGSLCPELYVKAFDFV